MSEDYYLFLSCLIFLASTRYLNRSNENRHTGSCSFSWEKLFSLSSLNIFTKVWIFHTISYCECSTILRWLCDLCVCVNVIMKVCCILLDVFSIYWNGHICFLLFILLYDILHWSHLLMVYNSICWWIHFSIILLLFCQYEQYMLSIISLLCIWKLCFQDTPCFTEWAGK